MKSLSNLKRFAGVLLSIASLTLAAPTWAAGLVQVSSFGSNPGALGMYKYVPDGLPSGAPLVVAMHGCTQSATDYYNNSGWPKMADQFKFAVVFPNQTSSNNSNSCFNWYQSGDYTRGQGEALSIKQMVDYMKSNHGSDPARIYVTGLSAGGVFTSVMLASYSDVFKGGAIVAGIAFGCGTDITSGVMCMSQSKGYSPQQWGDLVRNANSGYSGPWPRVAIFQGTSDTTVYPLNADEERDQWTNIWGISQTPTSTDSSSLASTTITNYDKNGQTVVKVYKISGMAHGQPVKPGSAADQCGTTGQYYLSYFCAAYEAVKFWGIDGSSSSSSSSSSSGGGTTVPSTPTGLTVTGTTSSSVSLSWNAMSGATSYNVYRGTTKVGSPTSSSYTDSGLTASTTYTYQVSAVNSVGESAKSSSVNATTQAAGTCYTASNYAHVTAGRAHMSYTTGHAYANGSNQDMGLYNTYTTTTLKMTGTNYYVIGTCS